MTDEHSRPPQPRTELAPAIELAQYLPLSIKTRVDERGVTSNWSSRLGELLVGVSGLAADLDLSADEVADALTRSIAIAVSPHAERAALETAPSAAVVGAIRSAAARLLGGTTRTRIGQAGAVLADAYDLARATARPLAVDAVLSGAVALARSGTAPLPIRAVIRDRTLVATDAGWSFGTGAELRGSAAELVLFLYGRAGVPGADKPRAS